MSEGSDIQTGEIPLDDLYETLRSYRDEYAEYVRGVCRVRLVYESRQNVTLEVSGPITHVPGDSFGWWLGIHDEDRERDVALDLSVDDHGNEEWIVENEDGRTLGELQQIEVSPDV